MRFENIRSIKPLTKLMIQLLQDYRNPITSNVEIFDHYDDACIQGLIERGLLKNNSSVKEENTQIRYSITQLGKEYLDHYFPGL